MRAADFVAKKIWPLNALLVAIDDVNGAQVEEFHT
jgi:hypothetical protein